MKILLTFIQGHAFQRFWWRKLTTKCVRMCNYFEKRDTTLRSWIKFFGFSTILWYLSICLDRSRCSHFRNGWLYYCCGKLRIGFILIFCFRCRRVKNRRSGHELFDVFAENTVLRPYKCCKGTKKGIDGYLSRIFSSLTVSTRWLRSSSVFWSSRICDTNDSFFFRSSGLPVELISMVLKT